MQLTYFPDNDKPSTESEEIAPDVVVDFDAAGGVVGLDIDLASSKVLEAMFLFSQRTP
jgi:uncharacterized protein YuzE